MKKLKLDVENYNKNGVGVSKRLTGYRMRVTKSKDGKQTQISKVLKDKETAIRLRDYCKTLSYDDFIKFGAEIKNETEFQIDLVGENKSVPFNVYADLEAEFKALKIQNDSLVSQLSVATLDSDELLEEYNRLSIKTNVAVEDANEARLEVQSLRKQLVTANLDRGILNKDLTNLKLENQTLKSKVTELEQQNLAIGRKETELYQQLGSQTRENESLKEDLSKLKEQLNTTLVELNNLKAENEKPKAKMSFFKRLGYLFTGKLNEA